MFTLKGSEDVDEKVTTERANDFSRADLVSTSFFARHSVPQSRDQRVYRPAIMVSNQFITSWGMMDVSTSSTQELLSTLLVSKTVHQKNKQQFAKQTGDH